MIPRTPLRKMQRQRGLTLIELMIALVLGLVVTGGAISLFVANREVTRATENLSRMQENSRIAFELMARSLRDAGGTPCGARIVTNVLNNSSATWWANWAGNVIRGYEGNTTSPAVTTGTGNSQRVDGTDALILMSGDGVGLTIISHDTVDAQFTVNAATDSFAAGDILMACDDRMATIFQATAVDNASKTITHVTGANTPGNCSKLLGLPDNCSNQSEREFEFRASGVVSRFSGEAWFIGYNSQGGRSLYRRVNAGDPVEIADNVTDMQLLYKARDPANSGGDDDYVTAADISDWSDVVAVNVELTFVSNERVSTTNDSPMLERKLIHVATLRNRAP